MRSDFILLLIACLAIVAPARAQAPATGQKPQVAGFEDMKSARGALDEIIRAYETGDIGAIQARLDPAMIGYQRFLDGMRRDTANLKQIRLHLFEANVSAGPDVAMIQAAWEKRFFGVADFTPGLFSGRSTFLMHRAKDGWRLAAVSGDNPFASESGVLATLTVMPAAFPWQPWRPAEAGWCPSASIWSTRIWPAAKRDDRSFHQPGRPRRRRADGNLARTLPSRQLADLPGIHSAHPGQRHLRNQCRAVPATLTFRYVDANPGANRPPATLMRSVTIR
jgi:hypothetical protein